jgi:hypothetical protein
MRGEILPSVIGPMSCAAAGPAARPQRSEDRTGPATSGGRRPHLTREEPKILTASEPRHVIILCGPGCLTCSHRSLTRSHHSSEYDHT